MKPRALAIMLTPAVLALAAAPRAAAQAAPDTAGLAQAVGTALVESTVPRIGRRNRLEVGPAATPFDSAVAARLRAAPEAGLPERPGYRNWIGTHGVTMRGDTAVVLVETGTRWPPTRENSMTEYRDRFNYLFVREPGGWRLRKLELVSHADVGIVRG